MLLFYPVAARDPDPSVLAEQGVSAPDDGVRLWTTLEALPEDTGPVLVVDPRRLPGRPPENGQSVHVSSVPPAAICNADPYRAPAPVTAGGGYVGCPLPDDVALLLIFRRGVWDLPKGTKDPGESVEGCARREVQEEVGIEALRLVSTLGTTQHGYPDGDRYAVKRTHWYLMRTPERAFEPDRREGIRRVARGRWSVARAHMGYDTLRRHMDRVEDTVRAALRSSISPPGSS
ncbi:MAG: NUDIX domain-containing protein [Salinibacter sp.]|uniref:NUDIX hydrolase n=1 Tax=Salinibacter sp. TaxID=2065818 RepID=UPI002FC2F67A